MSKLTSELLSILLLFLLLIILVVRVPLCHHQRSWMSIVFNGAQREKVSVHLQINKTLHVESVMHISNRSQV